MPSVSRFYGIIISMYYEEHNPPHFHAIYNDHKAIIEIKSLKILEGALPPRALGLVMEWASLNQLQLLNNWEAARAGKLLEKIQPL